VVSLHWHPQTNQLRVSILDCRELDIVAVPIEDGQNPLDVFHHPYAYAATRRAPVVAVAA
jgi:hypothetical protein